MEGEGWGIGGGREQVSWEGVRGGGWFKVLDQAGRADGTSGAFGRH